MTNNLQLKHISFGESKANIILAQYYMKEKRASKKIRNRYYANVNSFTSDPTDKEKIESILIYEKLLKVETENNIKTIHITKEGCYVLEHGIIKSEYMTIWNKEIALTVSFSSLLIALSSLFISVLQK